MLSFPHIHANRAPVREFVQLHTDYRRLKGWSAIRRKSYLQVNIYYCIVAVVSTGQKSYLQVNIFCCIVIIVNIATL